jgi:hypothetical protein
MYQKRGNSSIERRFTRELYVIQSIVCCSSQFSDLTLFFENRDTPMSIKLHAIFHTAHGAQNTKDRICRIFDGVRFS